MIRKLFGSNEDHAEMKATRKIIESQKFCDDGGDDHDRRRRDDAGRSVSPRLEPLDVVVAALFVVIVGGLGFGSGLVIILVIGKVVLAEAPRVLGVDDRRREVGVEVGLGGAGGG